MNIFWLNDNPKLAAQDQCNRHVVKMTLETAQILSHVCHKYGVSKDNPYKPLSKAHDKHPSVQWAAESSENFQWLIEHGLALSSEYTKRYKKIHKSESVISWAKNQNLGFTLNEATPIKLAINKTLYPICYSFSNPVDSYRYYYVLDKHKFAKWTNVEPPEWWLPLYNQLIIG